LLSTRYLTIFLPTLWNMQSSTEREDCASRIRARVITTSTTVQTRGPSALAEPQFAEGFRKVNNRVMTSQTATRLLKTLPRRITTRVNSATLFYCCDQGGSILQRSSCIESSTGKTRLTDERLHEKASASEVASATSIRQQGREAVNGMYVKMRWNGSKRMPSVFLLWITPRCSRMKISVFHDAIWDEINFQENYAISFLGA
jgi:hypothetical protein